MLKSIALSSWQTSRALPKAVVCLQQSVRCFAAKKKETLTDAQVQLQKHAAELNFREKTTIRGTLFEYHEPQTSIKYMESEAFKKAYGDKLIWEYYIRNFKGQKARQATRHGCIVGGRYSTGNPCPICRDPYLVVNYRNIKLLQQFISPNTGQLYESSQTGVCRRQHENLRLAYERACDYGLIDHYIPDRIYTQDTTPKIPSVLLGVVIGAKRNDINEVFENLKEKDISLQMKPEPQIQH